jgi:hypothetical protein
MRRSAALVVVGAALLVALGAGNASAQTVDGADVSADFELGGYDSALGDWRVSAVLVTGPDLADGERFLIEIDDVNGDALWFTQVDWDGPSMRLPVDAPVAAGDVAMVVVGQEIPPASVLTVPPSSPSAVSPEAGTVPPPPTSPPPSTAPSPSIAPAPPPSPPSPSPEVFSSSGGGAGSGLATSMVVILVMLALIFRAPLFGAFQPRVRQ